MKLSWSHKLFFKINAQVGKKKWLDMCMIFCAKWLIWVLFLAFVFFVDWGRLFYNRWAIAIVLIVWGMVVACSFAVSYLTAIIWKHPRPVREFPETKTLIKTMGTWKSFPSDHTMGATLLSLGVLFLSGSVWLLGIFWVVTLFIAMSRIYVGVHYPRDIIGGLIIPILCYIVFTRFIF
jgi:undecaprenyl-diphosphatase